ncbi:MAG: dihydroflavonol-4-reductase [Bacteroidia bacterium]|jgi:dihydroflavonol-4-reductase
MKVFVTGGTGLVGVHCVRALIELGHKPHVLVRNREKLDRVLAPLGLSSRDCEVSIGDINSEPDLRAPMLACNAVVHAAGLFSNRKEDAALMQQTNVEGTRRVMQLASELKLDPIIHVSSILALFPPPGKKQTADDPVRCPKSVYAATKAAAERVAREFQDRHCPVVCVYPGAVQGPFDPTFSDGPKMIARYLKSGQVLVTDGGLVYTDVRDLANLIAQLVESGRGPRRYMFGGQYLSHAKLHNLLADLTGRTLGAQRFPAKLLRLMGRINDIVSAISGKSSALTYEATAVLTQSVPCDDQAAIGEFKLEPRTAQESFRDLLLWMFETDRLSAQKVGKLAEKAQSAK